MACFLVPATEAIVTTIVAKAVMATVGPSMAVLVTAVWAVMTVVSDKILKRKPKETAKLGGDAV